MKTYKHTMIWALTVLMLGAVNARESSTHTVTIRIIRPNMVNVQPAVLAVTAEGGPNVKRFLVDWKLGSVSKKMTLSMKQAGPDANLVCRTTDENGTGKAKTLLLSDVDQEMHFDFSRSAGGLSMERKRVPSAATHAGGGQGAVVTYTVSEI